MSISITSIDQIIDLFLNSSSNEISLNNLTKLKNLTKEIEQGNIEYKYHFLLLNNNNYLNRLTQFKWRLNEGHGKAYYYLGVFDDGKTVGINKILMLISLIKFFNLIYLYSSDSNSNNSSSTSSNNNIDSSTFTTSSSSGINIKIKFFKGENNSTNNTEDEEEKDELDEDSYDASPSTSIKNLLKENDGNYIKNVSNKIINEILLIIKNYSNKHSIELLNNFFFNNLIEFFPTNFHETSGSSFENTNLTNFCNIKRKINLKKFINEIFFSKEKYIALIEFKTNCSTVFQPSSSIMSMKKIKNDEDIIYDYDEDDVNDINKKSETTEKKNKEKKIEFKDEDFDVYLEDFNENYANILLENFSANFITSLSSTITDSSLESSKNTTNPSTDPHSTSVSNSPYLSSLMMATLGPSHSGKSTLIGVLLSNSLDNGRGLARTEALTLSHEIETGKTSYLCEKKMKFNSHKDVRNFYILYFFLLFLYLFYLF